MLFSLNLIQTVLGAIVQNNLNNYLKAMLWYGLCIHLVAMVALYNDTQELIVSKAGWSDQSYWQCGIVFRWVR